MYIDSPSSLYLFKKKFPIVIYDRPAAVEENDTKPIRERFVDVALQPFHFSLLFFIYIYIVSGSSLLLSFGSFQRPPISDHLILLSLRSPHDELRINGRERERDDLGPPRSCAHRDLIIITKNMYIYIYISGVLCELYKMTADYGSHGCWLLMSVGLLTAAII